MDIIYKKVETLIAADYNPRTLSKKQAKHLAKSLKKFNIVEPAVINTFAGRENIIVGGHQRIRIAKELKIAEFPCVEVCLNEEDEKELNIRLNKNTGDFDIDMLANNFDIGDLMFWGFEDSDFGMFDDEPTHTDLEEKNDIFVETFTIEITCVNDTERKLAMKELSELGYDCKKG